VLPDWVDEKDNGTKYLTIRGSEALAVEALRELEAGKDAEIAALRDELEVRDARAAALEARVAEVEAVARSVAASEARLALLER
jgi:hypothetical protein